MVDDHVRPEVAKIKAGGCADACHALTAQRLVQVFEVGADDLPALLAAIGIVASRSGADEEEFFAGVSHASVILSRADGEGSRPRNSSAS